MNPCQALAILIIAAAANACDSAGTGATSCPTAQRCDGTPIGTWEFERCEPVDDLTYTETSVVAGETSTRRCTITLSDHAIIESELFIVAADGTFTKASSFAGPWSGIAAPECLSELELVCNEVPRIGAFGISNCDARTDGCHCEGEIEQSGSQAGTWVTGGGTLILEGTFSREWIAGGEAISVDGELEDTYTMCAGAAALQIEPLQGGTIAHYRRLAH